MTKPTLLLIPGLACDAGVWEYQEKHLADLVKSKVAVMSGASTVDAIVEQCIEDMPEQFLLAGHSLGAWACIEILKKYPVRVTKLCILATSADLDSPMRRQNREKRLELAINNNFEPVARELTDTFTHHDYAKPKVFEIFNRNRELFITQTQVLLNRDSNINFLPQIKQKTLVAVGREDRYFLESTKFIADYIPNCQFQIIEDCGHMLTLEKPEETTNLMRMWIEQ